MAVDTTVQVVMPAMGDSVSEGTILEWHKQEGDSVSEDETIVEISTDKVDAEVPSPATGTVVKVHAAEGDTVHVGALLAEIALNGGAPSSGNGSATLSEPEAEAEVEAEPEAPAEAASGEAVEIVMPAMGESVSEGVILEWAKQPGDQVAEDETIVEISTDKVDAEVPAPASGVMGEILAEPGDTVTVGQVIGRMQSGPNGASAAAARGEARRAGGAGRAEGGRAPRRHPHLAGRAPRRRGRGHRRLEGQGHGPRRPDPEGRRAVGRVRQRRSGRDRGRRRPRTPR